MGALYGVILHGSRSGRPEFSRLRGDSSEGWRTIKYVQQPGTTSYNWLIDYDGVVYELAGWKLQAWHAGHPTTSLHMNTNWYGVAFAQADTWEPITAEQHASAKWLLGEISRRSNGRIPLARQVDVPSRHAAKGITQHMDTGQGRSSGKSDVGALLKWGTLGL